jgi:dGTPase
MPQRWRRQEPGGVGWRFLTGRSPSLEAQLCNLADEIAYNAHDIDDGVRSGLITLEQLEDVPLFDGFRREALAAHPQPAGAGCCTRRSGACSAPRSMT